MCISYIVQRHGCHHACHQYNCVVLNTIYLSTHPGNPSVCRIDEYHCNNDQCIPLTQKCDGQSQCADGSDETGCSSTGRLRVISSTTETFVTTVEVMKMTKYMEITEFTNLT